MMVFYRLVCWGREWLRNLHRDGRDTCWAPAPSTAPGRWGWQAGVPQSAASSSAPLSSSPASSCSVNQLQRHANFVYQLKDARTFWLVSSCTVLSHCRQFVNNVHIGGPYTGWHIVDRCWPTLRNHFLCIRTDTDLFSCLTQSKFQVVEVEHKLLVLLYI